MREELSSGNVRQEHVDVERVLIRLEPAFRTTRREKERSRSALAHAQTQKPRPDAERQQEDSQLDDERMFDPSKDGSLVVDVLDLLKPDDLGLCQDLEREVRHGL